MFESFRSEGRPLRVKRVRHYRVPRYPSHLDPDPTTTPELVPYPWKSSVVAAVLTLTEANCGKPQPTATAIPKKPERVLSDSEQNEIKAAVAAALKETPKGVENPFRLKLGVSGLPHVASPYGTGAATPLDAVIAQRLISDLFRAEGMMPLPTIFDEKDFTVGADGYDGDKRIGYVIVDSKKLGAGAFRYWVRERMEGIASGEVRPQSAYEEFRLKEETDSIAAQLTERLPLNDKQKAQLAAAGEIKTSQARANAYLALLSEIDEPKLSMAEIEGAEKMSEAHQRYLAVISVFDRRFAMNGLTPEQAKQIGEIEREADKRTFANVRERRDWLIKQRETLMAEMNRQRLTHLARAVREYIAWARRNGVQ